MLFEKEDKEKNEDLRKKPPKLVGGRTMRPGVKSGKLFDQETTMVQKEIGKLDKVRQ